MTDATYDQLKAQAILGCETAGDIMESLAGGGPSPAAVAAAIDTCKIILMGAQVYATLAAAEAEKDSMREFQERVPARTNPRPPPFGKGPLRSVKKDEEN